MLQSNFNPYKDNKGSVVAIAGDDFAAIGADTRLSSDFSISTRNQKKLFQLAPTTVLGAAGCWADTLTLTRLLRMRVKLYEQDNNHPITTPAVAQMLSNALYYKRFFPYFVMNVLAGLDAKGKGCVYGYDPVGHCALSAYHAAGSSQLLMPLLDNQIGCKNMQNVVEAPPSREKALNIIKDVFVSAAERDIHTGDSVDIVLITANGVEEEKYALRKD